MARKPAVPRRVAVGRYYREQYADGLTKQRKRWYSFLKTQRARKAVMAAAIPELVLDRCVVCRGRCRMPHDYLCQS